MTNTPLLKRRDSHIGLPAPGQAARAMALGLAGGLALELLKPLPAVQRILGRQA